MSDAPFFRRDPSCYEYANGAVPVSVTLAQFRKDGPPITYDKEEGFLTHFEGLKYPRPQFLDPFALRSVDNVKKYLKSWIIVLRHPSKFIDVCADFIFSELSEYFVKPEHYGRVSKEIYRVGNEVGINQMILKGCCTILDQDLNYRWPLQDMAQLIEKARFQKHPIRETRRIIKLLSSRWDISQAHKMKLLLGGITLLLLFSRRLRKAIKKAVEILDIDRMALKEMDLYHCLLQPNYNYLGITMEERKKKHAELFQ